ncbi:putative 2-aminoethylphosphonate ABC transporter periplasmic 2-aminoethylphosphonate-binding protein [Actinobacillus porcinus]|uniref:2-aminoethylphosphonate ABC transporter periplasmic 2-aminoethylphosphonate-binding protein n=1 Tax=Actinobacillus porcinus TaxID=51048 RepID=A0ABY6TIC9_9PAST|nr:ABC transporter substrate-binding protein [Actinobacillus porcinus]VFY92127.1 putative 2-aminoethylphosphonate ABC transporter periplasmic 2-aminoethylphosphonate-binding protein [Actinobacillus porcinus]VTU05790.1 putative 2-aminoethylphosphonate ABC transporter periplasmic 2-aminoethylphosphonate-binding protein [Actinobacillus porcinus]
MKKFCLILIFLLNIFFPVKAKELVIATSFSPDTSEYLAQQWQAIYPDKKIRLINRTVNSLTQLLTRSNVEDVDLIMSSSPFLFQRLQDSQRLLILPEKLQKNHHWVPKSLATTTTTVAFSGYGIFYHKELLKTLNLPAPTDWDSLMNSNYFNKLLISSPSRSGTNHIMLEMLLQQRGWQQGWQDFLTLASNVSLISSRSFNVAEKIQMGLAAAGLSIDTYTTYTHDDPQVGFVYFPRSVISPTFIAIHKNSRNIEDAQNFISYLLSDKGQKIVAEHRFAKFPVVDLPKNDRLYAQQQKLLAEPLLDYDLLLARQYLVEKLFDIAITFRLTQLKEAWAVIYAKEKKTNKKLTALRQILTAIPVDEKQANDEIYLSRLKNDRSFAVQQEKQWAIFFQQQINRVLSQIEEE